MREPAHKIFINKFINWEIASDRLSRYKNIAEIFPIETLIACSEKPPFYCHYLGLRLGTWEDENLFGFLDQLMEIGKRLPGWDRQYRVPGGCEFDKFWGFVWELQTASFFANRLCLKTEWKNTGPDIKVTVGTSEIYAECTTYRKSFGLEEFIGELFHLIHPKIKVGHAPCLRFSLPKDNSIEAFLDGLYTPFLDPIFLPQLLEEVQQRSPMELPIPRDTENFYVYLVEQRSTNQNIEFSQVLTSSGDPEVFLILALEEILNNKSSSNKLLEFRPNLLMVNFLLGSDWQLARSLRSLPRVDFGTTYDGIFLTSCGIDEIPSFQGSFIDYKPEHPVEILINGIG